MINSCEWLRITVKWHLTFLVIVVRDKLNKIQNTFNKSAGLSGFAVKNSAEKICVGLCGRKPLSQGGPVCGAAWFSLDFFC